MTDTFSNLRACLEEETRLMGEFMQALEEEAKVLEEGAAEAALAQTTALKNSLADQLSAQAETRNVLLNELGFERDGPGLLAATQAHAELASLHRRLLDVTEKAQMLNEANGRIIEVFLDHNQRTLDTLRRLTGAGEIYDASGRKRSATKGSGRNIKAG